MPARDEARVADQFRIHQALIAATLTRDIIRLLRALFTPSRSAESWAATRTGVAALIRDGRQQSAALAARTYPQLRLAAGVTQPLRPVEPIDLPDERLLANIDATGIATYERAVRAGAPANKAADRAAVTLSGTGSRLALEGGRSVIEQTVQNDEDALGWMRISDDDPCSWCAVMVSRGAVYKNAGTAGRNKNARFTGDGEFKWHDHCGCQAVPVFIHDDPRLERADDLYRQWLEVTAGHSGQDALNTWRRYWEARETTTTQGA